MQQDINFNTGPALLYCTYLEPQQGFAITPGCNDSQLMQLLPIALNKEDYQAMRLFTLIAKEAGALLH
jgi:hypothetical protein